MEALNLPTCGTAQSPLALTDTARVLRDTPVIDLHTHLFPCEAGGLGLWGIDALLTYHYLVAETLRLIDLPRDSFWQLDRTSQADMVWKTLFIERTPLSEACRGVVTALQRLGLDPARDRLPSLRRWFAAQDPEEHCERCFEVAGVHAAFMTNSPWNKAEEAARARQRRPSSRLRGALRLDTLLLDWPQSAYSADGFRLCSDYDSTRPDPLRIKDYLARKVEDLEAEYLMAAWPPAGLPADPKIPYQAIMHQAILPFCEESGLPLALMSGIRPSLNPALRTAGAGVEPIEMAPIENLVRDHPNVRFLLTLLSRESQHHACVMARKFANLHLFGCWWFMNNPTLVRETTSLRLEMLGPTFTAQHSDARVIEQLIYKWDHTREILARVLDDRYADLTSSGWPISEENRKRDAAQLLGGAAEAYLRKRALPSPN
jgi:hypothetical protein